MYRHAGGEDGLDIPVQIGVWQAVAGDAVAQHTAQTAAALEHIHLVPHQRQIIGGGQAGGAGAHHRHPFSGGGQAGRSGDHPGMVHGAALQTPDIHGVIHRVAAAAGLAGVLADEGAGRGEGVVLADLTHGVGKAAGLG